MLSISIDDLPRYIALARKSNNNILVVGDPGVGKSQVINGMAGDEVKVTTFTGSSTYEETVNGIPFRDPNGSNPKAQLYTEPSWLAEMIEWAEEHPSGMNLLFIDEFNTASPEVIKTFLSILTEKRVPTQSRPLPKNTVIVAAMNPCDQNNGEELIRPLVSRFMTLRVVSTRESYRRFITGEMKKSNAIDLREERKPLLKNQVNGILDQISDSEWGVYEEGSYHEINPRSMTNFMTALEWTRKPEEWCSKLGLAFIDRDIEWIGEDETTESKHQDKVKRGVEYPTFDELDIMQTDDLKAYYMTLQKPTLKSTSKLLECKVNCRNILMSRGVDCESLC